MEFLAGSTVWAVIIRQRWPQRRDSSETAPVTCTGRPTPWDPITIGTVFKLTPSNGGWIYTLLHEFSDAASGGEYPIGGLALDAQGNLYGTASGGTYGAGVVWEITP